MFRLPSLNCLVFLIVLLSIYQFQPIRSSSRRPGNLLSHIHIQNPNARKMAGMKQLQQVEEDEENEQLVVYSGQQSSQNQQQQSDQTQTGKQSTIFGNAVTDSSSQEKISSDQKSNEDDGISLFASSPKPSQTSDQLSSPGKTSSTAGAKTSFVLRTNSTNSKVPTPKQGITSITNLSPVSAQKFVDTSLQTQIDGITLTLRPAQQPFFSQDSFEDSISDLFFNSIDTESKSALDSTQVAMLARSNDKNNDENVQTCPNQKLAKQSCPFSNGISELSKVTDFYNHLVGSCNFFALSGTLSQSSQRFHDPFNLAENECCARLEKMWEDEEKQKVVRNCSCNRDFKCADNFREWGVLGPFQGSNVQDLLNYCGIKLDSSAVSCT